MRNIHNILRILILVLLSAEGAISQSLPVGTPVIEDLYRREQLLGHIDSNVSFTIRPLFPKAAFGTENTFRPLDSLDNEPVRSSKIYFPKNKDLDFQILPINLTQQYNTHHPYGWNDGAMIPARGYQSLLSAGVYARYKFLSIQLQPEFLYAENREFDGFTQAEHNDKAWQAWYYLNNRTDLPERFGSKPFTKVLSGQSSIRVTFDPVSLGLSTGNIWWGPGIRNSIVMTNTARGFGHLTLNTTKPIQTPVGSFESQIVAGKLEGSGFSPLVPGQMGNRDDLYVPKSSEWRYLSGLIFTYQPKWVPGFFLGLTRNFQIYNNDLGNSLGDYFPFFGSYQKKEVDPDGSGVEDAKSRDQLTSLFVRWLFKDANAEIYLEFGKNDHSWNLRDFLLEPSHARAYIFGFRKIFKTGNRPGEIMQVSMEATQLAQSANFAGREAGSFYEHGIIKQGYTNNGEVLGAGIGPGGSMQSLDVSWHRGIKKIGLQIERLEHSADLYHNAFDIGELRRHWVDLGIGLNGDWNYKNFLFSSKLNYTKSFNYQWKFKEDRDVFYWDQEHFDTSNFQLGLTIGYVF